MPIDSHKMRASQKTIDRIHEREREAQEKRIKDTRRYEHRIIGQLKEMGILPNSYSLETHDCMYESLNTEMIERFNPIRDEIEKITGQYKKT